jgi:hypothetical protein
MVRPIVRCDGFCASDPGGPESPAGVVLRFRLTRSPDCGKLTILAPGKGSQMDDQKRSLSGSWATEAVAELARAPFQMHFGIENRVLSAAEAEDWADCALRFRRCTSRASEDAHRARVMRSQARSLRSGTARLSGARMAGPHAGRRCARSSLRSGRPSARRSSSRGSASSGDDSGDSDEPGEARPAHYTFAVLSASRRGAEVDA